MERKLVPFLALPLASCFFSSPPTYLTDVAAPEISLVLALPPIKIGGDASVYNTVSDFELVLVGVSGRSCHEFLHIPAESMPRHTKADANKELASLARASQAFQPIN